MLLFGYHMLRVSEGWGYFPTSTLLGYFFYHVVMLRECIVPYLPTNLAPFSLDNVHSTVKLGPRSLLH